jgi:C-terminal processing protease CtpA/Prc
MRPVPLLLVATLIPSFATRPATAPALDVAAQKTVVESLVRAMRSHYVFPEVAEYGAEVLLDKLARGGYRPARAEAFAEALNRDLLSLTEDRRLRVRLDPDPSSPADITSPMGARENFGVSKVEVLPGNVGLLDLRFFGPAEQARQTLDTAMALLANTDALILDLRQSRGGDPETVAHLCSYFFSQGSRVHLEDVYIRTRNLTRQLWTRPSMTGARYTGKPVYVLTSAQTFSGGEALGYDLQAQKRATVVGETTAGGANPGETVGLGRGFLAFIPAGEIINPVTRSSWEQVGVKPDLATPAARALMVAHATALRTILKNESDADRRASLVRVLAMVEKGSRGCRRS